MIIMLMIIIIIIIIATFIIIIIISMVINNNNIIILISVVLLHLLKFIINTGRLSSVTALKERRWWHAQTDRQTDRRTDELSAWSGSMDNQWSSDANEPVAIRQFRMSVKHRQTVHEIDTRRSDIFVGKTLQLKNVSCMYNWCILIWLCMYACVIYVYVYNVWAKLQRDELWCSSAILPL